MSFPFDSVVSIEQHYCFDQYDDFIEAGRYGNVFRAVCRADRSTVTAGTPVAIKVLPKSAVISDRDGQTIVNEVDILKRLGHRNCVHFVEALQSACSVFIVMELISGEDLYAGMQHMRAPAARESWACDIVLQLLHGLRYLHRDLFIVHRDMKPENILLSADADGPRVVIVDFGLAKCVGRRCQPAPRRPLIGTVRQRSVEVLQLSPSLESMDSTDSHSNSPMLSTPCGTLKYLPPETIKGMNECGLSPHMTTRGDALQADMYSLGIVVYAMLSNHPPFTATVKGQLLKQMEDGPSFADGGWDGISEEAKSFVHGLLCPSPSQRPTVRDAIAHPWVSRNGCKFVSAALPNARQSSFHGKDQLNSVLDLVVDDGATSLRGPSGRVQTIPFQCTQTCGQYFDFISVSEEKRDAPMH